MSDDFERDEFEPADESRAPAGREPPARPGHEPDEYVYVDDPVSKWWVVLMVAVFVAIVLYGLLLGRGGLLNPKPTPSPSPSPSASPTVTVSPAPTNTISPAPTSPPTATPSGT